MEIADRQAKKTRQGGLWGVENGPQFLICHPCQDLNSGPTSPYGYKIDAEDHSATITGNLYTSL